MFKMLCLQMHSSVVELQVDSGCTQWGVCVCACAGGWEIILGPLEKRNKADSGPFLQVCFSWQRKVGEMLYF